MAHALLSTVYTWRALSQAFPDRESEFALAREHVETAQGLDADNPFVLVHCAETALYTTADLDRARSMLEDAITRYPNDPNGLALLVHARRMIGDEARTSLALIEQAVRLSCIS